MAKTKKTGGLLGRAARGSPDQLHNKAAHATHVNEELKTLRAAFRFLFDLVTGAVLFLVILGVEGLLTLAAHKLTGTVADETFTKVVDGLHLTIFVVDCVLYVWLVVTSAIRLAKESLK